MIYELADLSPRQLAIFIYILTKAEGGDIVRVSYAELCGKFNVSLKTMCEFIEALVKKGFISKNMTPPGRGAVSTYQILKK